MLVPCYINAVYSTRYVSVVGSAWEEIPHKINRSTKLFIILHKIYNYTTFSLKGVSFFRSIFFADYITKPSITRLYGHLMVWRWKNNEFERYERYRSWPRTRSHSSIFRRGCGKPRKTLVMITGVPGEIRIDNLLSMSESLTAMSVHLFIRPTLTYINTAMINKLSLWVQFILRKPPLKDGYNRQ
jgi:hypothetical protein